MSDIKQLNTDLSNNSKRKFSLREIIIKYLSYLPLFLLSLVICLGSAYLYIRYKVPIYKAGVQMMVGGNTSAQNAYNQDIISQAVSGVRAINIDNEIQLIRSRKLLEKVVREGEFNVYYSKEGNIKVSDAYLSTPFIFKTIAVADSFRTYVIRINKLGNKGGELEINKKSSPFKWGEILHLPGITCVFNSNNFQPTTEEVNILQSPYIIQWRPIAVAAADMQGRLAVTPVSTKTTVILLNLTVENPRKGEDFLNMLARQIITSDVELKREASVNTINFIDSRLEIVAKDLGGVEDNLKDYRTTNRFLDIQSEFLYYQTRMSDAEKLVDNLQLDIKIIELIEDYLRKGKGDNGLIPSNLDVNDIAFNSMIIKYNDLQNQRQKLTYNTLDANYTSEDLDSQLNEIKRSILEAASNLKRAKQLRINTFQSRNNDDMGKLSTMPDKERTLQEINRQRQIKERLYLYLLQRREETAISSVSTTSNYQTMDAAWCSNIPIEPKSSQIKTFAIIIGLLLPIGLIYLLDLLNDKVTTRNDISDKTDLPIVGEITHVDNNEEIVVENSRNVVAEQFRIFRSNLQFIMPKEVNKNTATTFLITSSVSGEGKSFVSLNLACVLSLTGKKVALLEFDLRKLKSIKVPEAGKMNTKGITNYLIGQTDDADDIISRMDRFPTLSIYNTGPIPPNPAELIISSRMETLFAKLKTQYDYIVIDSAPIGLVSDSFALGQYADAVLYIVRQRYTFKKQLEFINDLKKDGKLHNLALVINDVNLAGRYGYYGYGYGYGYGYMYRYGFGYGYNRYIYGGKKNDPYFNVNKKGYFDNTQKTKWWQRIFGK